MLLAALDNTPGVPRDIVILNAGAALYAAGMVESIDRGLVRAREVVVSGAALAKLEEFVGVTRMLAGQVASA